MRCTRAHVIEFGAGVVNFNCTAAQRARLSFERNEKLRGANGAGRKST